ncbi:unnamed protein product [Closterium sp. NIES-54]
MHVLTSSCSAEIVTGLHLQPCSSCEAEIYAGAMAAQELCWLTYLLTDLGEPPRSPPVLYVDNKAMLALCREHRLEHRTKHIALRYFLARELQQRGPLRLAYVASQANTVDIFSKALQPCDHQRFCNMLAMASLRVLAFDHEGRPVQFDTWQEDLQLYLLSDSKDSVSLFDLASGAATAPPATADSSTRSQWLTRDAAARLAIRNHLPLAECTHFGQHRTAQALYDTVVARYSSPATAALGRLLLPYLFPELSAFATVEDLVSHLRASDARYRAAIPAEFLDRNSPPMYITLYIIATRLPDSLRSVRDHFLSLDPTSLTIDLLEHHLLTAETSTVAVGAAHGTPRPPFFEGCSPSPLAPSYASAAAAADVSVPEDVGAASASAKRRSSKGKGGRGGGGGSGGGGGGSGSGGGGSSGGGSGGGTVGRSGGSGGGGGGSGGSGGSGGGGTGGGGTGAWRVGTGGGQRQQQQRPSETPSPQQLREWFLRWASGGSCPIAIFDLEFDAILSAMYALSVSAEGDCYRCVPPDPGIAAAALGASESRTLSGTAPTQALHTFTLDSGASRCFFRDSTTLTPLHAPLLVRLADPSRAQSWPVPPLSSRVWRTAALQDAMVTTTTPGGQRVSICTCTRTGHHLATFTRRPGSSLYTLATEPSQVAASAQVSASGQVAASCACRLLSHQTLLWHHRLGHPSLPRLRGMHSRLLVSGLPRSLPPLPPSPAPPCLPCVEGRQRTAPHSSSFPTMTAPLQTLHMDVWGPAHVSGQSRERYFLLVVDDYSRALAKTFLSCVCTLTEVENGIAECRIGIVMEVARTSMIHAVAPHFLWPFAVQYAAHQLNLWPHVSLPETSPTLRWTGKVGDASVFRVWGSRAFVRDTSADKLSPRAIPCGPAPSGVSQVDPLPGPTPVQVAVDSGAARGVASAGAASGGAEPGGAESKGAETGGAELEGLEIGGAEPGGVVTGGGEPGGGEPGGAEYGGAEPPGAASSRVSAGASPSLSLQQLREWFVRRMRLRSGATGAGGAGPARAGGIGVAAGAGVTGGAATTAGDLTESGATGAGGAGAGRAGVGGPGARGAGVGGPGVGGAGAGGAEAVDPGGAMRPRPYFVPLLQQVLGTHLLLPLLLPSCVPRLTSRSRRYCRPLHCLLLLLTLSSPAVLPSVVPDPESDRARAAKPAVSCLLATAVTYPSFESAAASSLDAELLDFATACCLEYATALVAESASASPPSVGGECALGTDVLEDRQETTLVALGFAPATADPSLFLRTDTSLPPFYVLVYVDDLVFATAQTEALNLVKSELQKRHTCTDLGELRSYLGLQITRDRARRTITLTQSHMVHQFLQRFGFQFSSPQPTPLSTSHSLSAPPSDESVEPSGPYPELVGCLMYLMTCTRPDLAYPLSLLACYVALARHRKVHWDAAKRVLRYLCSTSGMGLVLGGRGPVVLTGHADASWVDDSATQRSSQGYTFSLGSGSVSWRSTRSSSVLSSSCEAEIYAGAMAAQELRWLTYLLTDLGEQPRSPPILYIDNKAMIALCQEH